MEVMTLVNGDEVVQGSVIEDAGKFSYIFAVKNGKALTTVTLFDTPEEAEAIEDEECFWGNKDDLNPNLKLHSQPILGKDKNGEDVRWGDKVRNSYNEYIVVDLVTLGTIKYIVYNNDKGHDKCSNVTKVKEEEKMITIKSKEYSEDTIHKSLKEYVKWQTTYYLK